MSQDQYDPEDDSRASDARPLPDDEFSSAPTEISLDGAFTPASTIKMDCGALVFEEMPAQIGRYPIEKRLGRGGMGLVYHGHDLALGRAIAIKVLAPQLSRDPEWAARFHQEALLLASLNHPNIATIHSLEEDGEQSFLTMEWIDGSDLAAILHQGPLGLSESLSIARQILRGLEAAHERSLVHRDLKPHNVMLTQNGHAKILDFGLAARVSRESDRDPATRHAGTPGYMSPEQIRGEEIDARTDLWAFGCVLYECLTGTPAFPGPSPSVQMDATLRSAPDLTGLPNQTPTSVRELLRSCWAPDPKDRLASAAEARKALETVMASRTWQGIETALGAGAPLAAGAAPDAGKHNLPRQVSSFVGRARQIEEIRALLDVHRLVTVKGVGGAGKTRTALRVGETSLDRFPGGVWWVELASLTEASGVARRIAAALSLADSGSVPLDQIAQTLGTESPSLLLIDNCEHVADEVARVVQFLAAHCPRLTILTTSRELLGVPGETVYSLPPLETPKDTAMSVARIAALDSVELFRQRALLVRPGFSVTAENAAAVANICRRLDGLPLAIELAAARVRSMPLAEIAQRLDQRFRLLTGSDRSALPQHRTLEALIAWSHDQLSPVEQAFFRRLSAFSGGWTLEAAEAVCADGLADFGNLKLFADQAGNERTSFSTAAPPIESWEVLDLLSRLIDKSLVDVDTSPAGTRYRLLETIRAFATMQAEQAGEVAPLSQRHREFFARWAKHWDAQMQTRAAEALAHLGADHDNLRLAINTAVNDQDVETALVLVAATSRLRHIRSYWTEARRDFERVQALPGVDRASYELQKALLSGLAGITYRLGDMDASIRHHLAALDLAHSADDARSASLHRLNLINVYGTVGRAEEAMAIAEELLAIWEKSPELQPTPHARGSVLLAIAGLHQGARRWEEADPLLVSALAAFRACDFEEGIAVALLGRATVALNTDRPEEAIVLSEEANVILRALGDRWKLASSLLNVAPARLHLGQIAQARSELEEATTVAIEMQDHSLLAGVLHGFALIAGREGDAERSARLSGTAGREARQSALLVRDVVEWDDLDHKNAEALGWERMKALYAEGAQLSVEEAVALARSTISR